MKKYLTTTIALLFLGCFAILDLYAQAPGAMTYQAEVRDSDGKIIKNTDIEVTIGIIEGSIGTTPILTYSEFVTTDKYGLFTVIIGDPENPDDPLYDLDWGNLPHHLKVQVTDDKNNTYDFGTSQFLSVPYALHAETAGSALNDNDANPANELQTLTLVQDKLMLSLTNDEVSLENYVTPWEVWSEDFLRFTGAVDIGDEYTSGPALRVDGNITVGKRGENPGTYGISGPDPESGISLAGGKLGGGQLYLFGPEHITHPGEVHLRAGGYERILINRDGNVGIGTTEPSEKLEVDGSVKATAFVGDGSRLTGIVLTESDPSVPTGTAAGQMQYWDGENWIMVPVGSDGQFLTLVDGIPTWASALTQTPILTTSVITNITSLEATSGGNITYDGGYAITARGVCWSTTPNPTINLLTRTNDGEGGGQFESSITNLTGNADYHVRAYAKYSLGIVYGEELQFSTSPSLTVSTGPVSDIRQNVAYIEGTILSDGGEEITEMGICYSTSHNPTKDDTYRNCTSSYDPETNKFGSNTYASLTANRTYYTRAYAINSSGIIYGQEVEFRTLPVEVPTVITYAPYAIRSTKAISGGEITFDGGNEILDRGLLYQKTVIIPDLASRTHEDDGVGSAAGFLCEMTELTPISLYCVQAYATNSAGTGYGEVHFFTPPPIRTDVEGNEYNTIQIGGQTWLADNLETTKYNDGSDIGTNVKISSDNTGARYSGHAVNTGILCPVGWHVPNNEEWQTLQDHAAGIAEGNYISMVLKDISLYMESYHYWYNTWPYINETGFSGIGTSIINSSEEIYYWSADESILGPPGEHSTGGYRYEIAPTGLYKWGCNLTEELAVRCIKD